MGNPFDGFIFYDHIIGKTKCSRFSYDKRLLGKTYCFLIWWLSVCWPVGVGVDLALQLMGFRFVSSKLGTEWVTAMCKRAVGVESLWQSLQPGLTEWQRWSTLLPLYSVCRFVQLGIFVPNVLRIKNGNLNPNHSPNAFQPVSQNFSNTLNFSIFSNVSWNLKFIFTFVNKNNLCIFVHFWNDLKFKNNSPICCQANRPLKALKQE